MTAPNVCVLTTDGVNCAMEMQHAFQVAGAEAELIHVNQLRSGDRNLRDYQGLAIPGGFSYGDDVASGKILAVELTSYLADQLRTFADSDKPILGVCNGFQVLERTGLLPNRTMGEQQATLTTNESGRFNCVWIELAVGRSACRFIQPDDLDGQPIPMQIAHGEGKFVALPDTLQQLHDKGQVVFTYVGENPNGSLDAIAGICDERGTILGMMPHPERSIAAFHPHRIRTEAARAAASLLFRNIVQYARDM